MNLLAASGGRSALLFRLSSDVFIGAYVNFVVAFYCNFISKNAQLKHILTSIRSIHIKMPLSTVTYISGDYMHVLVWSRETVKH